MPTDPKTGKRVKRMNSRHQLRQADKQRAVAERYLRGMTQAEIGLDLGISQAEVSKSLKKIRERWVENAAMEFSERKMIELAKIDHIETLATEGYLRSCAEQQVKTVKSESMLQPVKPKVVGGKKGNNKGARMIGDDVTEFKMVPVRRFVERCVKGQSGNPAFLDQMFKCVEMRMKLFGILDAKTVNNNTVNLNWDGLHSRPKVVDDPVEMLIQGLERKAEATLAPPSILVNGERNGKH